MSVIYLESVRGKKGSLFVKCCLKQLNNEVVWWRFMPKRFLRLALTRQKDDSSKLRRNKRAERRNGWPQEARGITPRLIRNEAGESTMKKREISY